MKKLYHREKFAPILKRAHAALEEFNLAIGRASPARLKARCAREFVPRTNEPLSTKLLCKIHARVKKGSGCLLQDIGKIRTRQNWIGPEKRPIAEAYFYPPKASALPRLLKNLHAYREKDPLVYLAVYFAQLLIIHPFMDGNGRVARAIVPFFLYRKKLIVKPYLFISPYLKKHRLDYFRRLYLITTRGSWEKWIIFFLKGIIESARASARA